MAQVRGTVLRLGLRRLGDQQEPQPHTYGQPAPPVKTTTSPFSAASSCSPRHDAHALGEQLVRTATDYAHQHSRRLVLDVMTKDTAPIRIYERLGWQRIGTTRHGTDTANSRPPGRRGRT